MKRSGKYAYVDGVGCTQAWQFGQSNTASRYAASCVPDGTAATAGNLDQSGSISGMGYLPLMPAEDDMAFVGVASGKTGEILNYTGDILITEATLNLPIEGGTPITWSSNFGVQGLLTKEEATLYEDDSRTPATSSKDAGIRIETSPAVFDPVPDVQNITLTFRRPPVTSVENGATYRESGNLEVDLSFDVRNDDFELEMYEANSIARVRVYVTDTLFYMLDAIIFKDKTNYVVDRRNGSMIGYSVSGIWTALKPAVTPVLGTILMPNGDVFYPTQHLNRPEDPMGKATRETVIAEFGGEEFTVSALGLLELEALETFVQGRVIAAGRESLPEGIDLETHDRMMDPVIAYAMSQTVTETGAFRRLMNTSGMVRMFYYSLKRAHPDITLQRCRDFIMDEEARTALTDAISMANGLRKKGTSEKHLDGQQRTGGPIPHPAGPESDVRDATIGNRGIVAEPVSSVSESNGR